MMFDEAKHDELKRKSEALFLDLDKRIGNLCQRFAGIEHEVVNSLAMLINANEPKTGELIADRLSFSQTLDLLADLVKEHLSSQLAEDWAVVIKELRDAAKTRNDIVHSSWWYVGDDSNTVEQQRARKRHKGRPSSHDATELLSRLSTEIDHFQFLYERLEDLSWDTSGQVST